VEEPKAMVATLSSYMTHSGQIAARQLSAAAAPPLGGFRLGLQVQHNFGRQHQTIRASQSC
jgi:hypothetical protein